MMPLGANDCLIPLVQWSTPLLHLGQAPGLLRDLLRSWAQWHPGSFPPLPRPALLTSFHLPGMSPKKKTLNGITHQQLGPRYVECAAA